jgi:alcohol dehydrogenase class IV
MQETLLVCSPSTREYLPQYERVHKVTSAPQKSILKLLNSEQRVVAIGGGAVIDTAKIISSKPITCYPTTAAGSSCTSHSVYWNGNDKLSIKGDIPCTVNVVEEYISSLPKLAKENTTYDVISHCLDSLWSINKTRESTKYAKAALSILKGDYTNVDLINAGNLGGKAIQICPTTILHSLSYPLTAYYGISHGRGLGYLLPRVCQLFDFDLSEYNKYPPVELDDIDWELVCTESLKYDKIYNVHKKIDKNILLNIFK